MQREYALAAAGAALLILTVGAAVLIPGALAERDADTPPGRIGLYDDVAVSPVNVTGDTATLELDVRLTHHGGPTENTSIEVRAIDAQTGLLVTATTVPIGTITDER